MQPEDLTPWIPILRDIAIVTLAAIILIHETLFSHNPNAVLIGAGLSLLGIPAAFRADSKRKNDKDDEDDPWSHLPR